MWKCLGKMKHGEGQKQKGISGERAMTEWPALSRERKNIWLEASATVTEKRNLKASHPLVWEVDRNDAHKRSEKKQSRCYNVVSWRLHLLDGLVREDLMKAASEVFREHSTHGEQKMQRPEAGAHDLAKGKEVELPEWNARERGAAKATPGLT